MSSIMSPGMHPVLGALEVIETGLDELAEANLWSLLDGESLEVRERLERLSSRLYGAKLAPTRDVDSRGAAVKAGASSLRTWLINRVHLHPGEATREVLLAHQLDTDLPATTAALRAGTITPAAATVIADSDAALRKTATAVERADGLPSFYPPTWIDPDRAPRRHIRYPPHPPPNRGAPGDGNATLVPFARRP
jgi:hypothetical protein